MEKRNPEAHSLCPKVKLQIPPLRYAPVGMTKWRVALHLGSGGRGWTESTYEDPHLANYPLTLSINYRPKS
jgi:hypothetical protein